MAVEIENRPKIAEVLQKLIDRRKIRPCDLAVQAGLPNNTIYMILGGKVNVPNGATLIAFADYFGVTVDYLLGRELDDNEEPVLTEKTGKGLIFIPIIHWRNINDWIMRSNWASHAKKTWGNPDRRYIEYSEKGSAGAFAVEVNNHYLTHVFPLKSLIIVNPKSEISDGDYVMVKDEDEEIAVWQIKGFDDNQYLQAIGIKKDAIELKPPLTVLGKVVECRQYYLK